MTRHYTPAELEKLLADFDGAIGPVEKITALGPIHVAAVDITRQFIEQAQELSKEKHEVARLTKLANEAFRAWDSDQDSRVGKLLAAMNDIGFCKTYRPDLMEPEE